MSHTMPSGREPPADAPAASTATRMTPIEASVNMPTSSAPTTRSRQNPVSPPHRSLRVRYDTHTQTMPSTIAITSATVTAAAAGSIRCRRAAETRLSAMRRNSVGLDGGRTPPAGTRSSSGTVGGLAPPRFGGSEVGAVRQSSARSVRSRRRPNSRSRTSRTAITSPMTISVPSATKLREMWMLESAAPMSADGPFAPFRKSPAATTKMALVARATASETVMNTPGPRPDHAVASSRKGRGRQTKPEIASAVPTIASTSRVMPAP